MVVTSTTRLLRIIISSFCQMELKSGTGNWYRKQKPWNCELELELNWWQLELPNIYRSGHSRFKKCSITCGADNEHNYSSCILSEQGDP